MISGSVYDGPFDFEITRVDCTSFFTFSIKHNVLYDRDSVFLVHLCKANIHVINFKEASGRFFFHFLEVFEKCIEYIRIFFIHFLEISKFW